MDPATGKVLWKSPGKRPGSGSFILAELGGRKQIVGYDEESLGGWDVATGERLWRIKPKLSGDFNVPTPIIWNEHLLVSTENNATRLYRFDDRGQIVPEPIATADDLVPDCHTPVVAGDRLFGVSGGLHCFDLRRGLTTLWTSNDPEFQEYVSLIASPERVLAATLHGKLVLIDAQSEKFTKLGELQLFDGEAGMYSHPALCGRQLFVRGSSEIVCLDLAPQGE